MTDSEPVERHHRITNNNAIDLHVGKRVRLRRTLLGLSQEQLGAEHQRTARLATGHQLAEDQPRADRLAEADVVGAPLESFHSP